MAIVFYTFCSVDKFIDAAKEFGYEIQESTDGWFAYDTKTHTVMGAFSRYAPCGTIERISDD